MKTAKKIIAFVTVMAILFGINPVIWPAKEAEALYIDYMDETFDPVFKTWDSIKAENFYCEQDDVHGNYALIKADNRYLAKKSTSRLVKDGVYRFDMDYMIGDTEGSKYIYWEKANGFRIYVNPNSIRATTSGNVTIQEGEYIENGPDTWHHISINCDFINKKYTLYLDYNSNPYLEWDSADDPSLQVLVVRIENDNAGGWFAFDNVRVYEVEADSGSEDDGGIQQTYRINETFDPEFNLWENINSTVFRCARDEEHGNYAIVYQGTYLAKKTATKVARNDLYYFEMDYKISSVGGAKYIYWENSNGFRIYFRNTLLQANGKNGAVIKNATDTWHHILVECDFPNKKYRLYLDYGDKPYLEWDTGDDPYLDKFIVRIDSGDENGYIAFDNVRLYDPEEFSTPVSREIEKYNQTYLMNNISDDQAIKDILTKTFTDAVNTAYEYPTYILNKYGLMNGETSTTFGIDDTITAGEFVEIVKKAYDVTEINTPVYEQIMANPSRTITELQAAAIILSVLGYDSEAEAAGGYPTGYRHVGNETCISRGLNIYDSDTATRGTVALLIYNSMGTAMKSTGKSLFDKIRPSIKAALSSNELIYVLQDNYYYRVEAYRVLMRYGITPEQITNDLVKILETGTTEQKKRAARAISDNQEPNSGFGSDIYRTLQHMASSSKMATSALLKVMKDEDEDVGVRIYALRALWMMNLEEVIPINYWYLALYTDTMEYSYTLLNKASDKLEMTNTTEDVQALIDALSCPDRDVVIRVIDTINRKAEKPELADKARAAIPALRALVSNADKTIAHQAAVALNTFGEETALPEITKAGPYLTSNDPVKLTISDNGNYTIDNGIFAATWEPAGNQSSAGPRSIIMHGKSQNIVTQNDVSWKQNGADRSGWARELSVVENTDDVVEISSKFYRDETFSYDLDFRYRVERGQSKIYAYIILTQPEDAIESTDDIQALIHQRINNSLYSYHISSEKSMGRYNKNPAFNVTPNGSLIEIEQATNLGASGEAEGKFIWWQGSEPSDLSGHVSMDMKLGYWHLYPSYEAFPANTLRTNLNEVTNMSSVYIEGQYFNWNGFRLPGGAYTKVYCPRVFYFNTGDSMIDMMEDAKAELAKEKEKWPYEWVDSDHYFERGSVTGTVQMADGSSPKGAYVIVNLYEGKEGYYDPQWQQNRGPYHYWTQIDNDDGVWSIENVHSGNYQVTVFKDGYKGTTYMPGEITVSTGKTTTVDTAVIEEESVGALAWRIGEPTGTWLYDAADVYDIESMMEYKERFPLGTVYKVDEAEPRYDWYSNQMPYGVWNGARKIVFNKDASIQSDALLTLAIASVRTGVHIGIDVNGTRVKNINYEYGTTDDSQNGRTFAYGRLQYHPIQIDKSLFKNGENEIEIKITNGAGHFLYDFVQLEYVDNKAAIIESEVRTADGDTMSILPEGAQITCDDKTLSNGSRIFFNSSNENADKWLTFTANLDHYTAVLEIDGQEVDISKNVNNQIVRSGNSVSYNIGRQSKVNNNTEVKIIYLQEKMKSATVNFAVKNFGMAEKTTLPEGVGVMCDSEVVNNGYKVKFYSSEQDADRWLTFPADLEYYAVALKADGQEIDITKPVSGKVVIQDGMVSYNIGKYNKTNDNTVFTLCYTQTGPITPELLIENGKIAASSDVEAVLYICKYDSVQGNLTYVKSYAVPAGTKDALFDMPANSTAFLWDKNMKPLCEKVSAE